MAAKIRQNDEVIVLAGKDKGKRGKVTQVLPMVKLLLKVSTSSLNTKTSSCFR